MPTPSDSPDRGTNLGPNDASKPEPRIPAPRAPGSHRVDFDWRGETAYYVEHDRRVWLSCIYWGGPKGSVSHIHGVWEYDDGRRERLTKDERAAVLQVVNDQAKAHENITLEIG